MGISGYTLGPKWPGCAEHATGLRHSHLLRAFEKSGDGATIRAGMIAPTQAERYSAVTDI